jgi:hypothetical protein
MPLDIWLRIRGETADVGGAVAEVDTALETTGVGTDWASLGTKLGASAKSAMSSPAFQGAIMGGLTMAVDWLIDGVQRALETPEGAEAQAALGTVGDALTQLRDEVLAPFMPVIVDLAEGLAPMVVSLADLVTTLLPALKPLIAFIGYVVVLVFDEVTKTAAFFTTAAETIGGLIDTVTTAIQTALGLVQDLLDGIAGVWSDIQTGIGNLLEPIRGLLGPIGDALAGMQQLWDFVTGGPPDSGDIGWGNGPGNSGPPGSGSMVVNPGGSPEQIVAALHTWARRNGGAAALERLLRLPA